MPKLLYARPAADAEEERKIRRLARSRHAPADWVMRAKMIAASWDGDRTSTIAARLGCHLQTVRERLARFDAEGLDGLGDRPGAGRKRRITEANGARSSRWPAPSRRAGPHGPPVGTCTPRLRRHPRSGPSTVWSRPPRPRGSGCGAVRCGGSWGRSGCAGGTPVPGRPVRLLTSPQKGGGGRALHPPASADHGDLRRRARPSDPADVPAGGGLVARRPPHQGTAGVRPRHGQDLGLRRPANPRRHRGHLLRAVAQQRRLDTPARHDRQGQPARPDPGGHRQPVQP
jgi:hypothetical protein